MFHPEAPTVIRLLLAVHIAAGALALFVVPAALAVRKGGLAHRRWGMAYVRAMAVVTVTALPLAPYFKDYFLLFIAVFSGYLVYLGWRTLARKRPAEQPAAPIDWIAASSVGAAGAGMYVMALVRFDGFSIALAVFGTIALALCAGSVRRFLRPPGEKAAWLFEHITMMLAGYIATVTAFSATNLLFINPIALRWLWPTVAGTALIIYYNARYRRKLAGGARLRQMVALRDPAVS